MSKRSLIEPAGRPPELLVRQLRLLAGVAHKAIAMGEAFEAERLLATIVADCHDFAERASSPEDLELVAEMHVVLAPVLRRLDEMTGRPWARSLEATRFPPWKPRLPPRGVA